MNNSCPNCRSRTLVPLCGGGVECLSCDYKEMKDDLELYAELMAAGPGVPPPTRAERHDGPKKGRQHATILRWQRVWAQDERLAEAAALRHGVLLEDLHESLRGWRALPRLQAAFHSVIADLAAQGLGINRIGRALGRKRRTIMESPGLAKGRARKAG